MPTYRVKDLKTLDEWDVLCSYNDLQDMLDRIPELVRVIEAPAIVSTTTSTLRKAGGEWSNLLGEIKKGSGRGNTIKN